MCRGKKEGKNGGKKVLFLLVGIRSVFVFPALFLRLRTAAPLWAGVRLCFVSLRVDLPTVWQGLGC